MYHQNQQLAEGDYFIYVHDLKLHFDRITIFPAALTLRHEIDETSPLHGATIERLEAERALFFVSVVGIDPVIAAEVQTQRDYTSRAILFGHRFVEIYHESEGKRERLRV